MTQHKTPTLWPCIPQMHLNRKVRERSNKHYQTKTKAESLTFMVAGNAMFPVPIMHAQYFVERMSYKVILFLH